MDFIFVGRELEEPMKLMMSINPEFPESRSDDL